MFLKNRNISSKIERSKVTDYAALSRGNLSYLMKGYTQINVLYANMLYRRPANQYENDFSMTYKVHDTILMLLVLLDLEKYGILHS